tara:strand:+ start:4677 stop:5114 length:438 start_codon:yes stop_codon:yes gene_type:complete
LGFYVYSFGTLNNEGEYTVDGWPGFILLLTWFLYFPIAETINGQTLGRRIMQLKVVTLNGYSISFGQAFKRRILDYFEIIMTFGLVAYVTSRNSERNQRVGDIWARTIVVGDESAICQHCNSKLTLTPDETISGHFTCPQCGKEN